MKSQSFLDSFQPQVIFLDAVGTLFGIKGSVGEIYREVAIKYGVTADAEEIDRAFIKSFKRSPPLAFNESQLEATLEREFEWWKNLAEATFTQVEVIDEFTDFAAFFSEIYELFATLEPWYIYPDVIPSLQNWQARGIQLGVISNFDTRLEKVLKIFEIDSFFSSITISSTAGFAKPDRKIFELALAKHKLEAHRACHIGDSYNADYQGAKNAGLRAFWLDRSHSSIKESERLPNLSSLG